MNGHELPVAERAAELRRVFDRSFAEAPGSAVIDYENLVAIRVTDDPYAIRVAEIAGVFAGKRFTPLPGSLPELLGIAGFRGAIVPVYDLAMVLGHSRSRAGAPRWLVLAAQLPVGLAFDRFDGHLRVGRETVSPAKNLEANQDVVRELVGGAAFGRPIVRVAAVLEAIGRRLRQEARSKER